MKQLTLKEAGAILDRKPDSLRRQAGRGVLRAEKIGRDWVTTDRDVEDYARNHLRRRRLRVLAEPTPDYGETSQVV